MLKICDYKFINVCGFYLLQIKTNTEACFIMTYVVTALHHTYVK